MQRATSPFIYLPNYHVPQQQVSGYESTFEHRTTKSQFASIRGGAERYSSAFPSVPRAESRNINASMINEGLARQFDRDTYVMMTATDRKRELVAFDQLRYTKATLANVSGQPGVSKISSNGQLDVFFVHPRTKSSDTRRGSSNSN
ncbi:MAG: hypothetical protein ABEI77_04680 [Halorientalis sp.]